MSSILEHSAQYKRMRSAMVEDRLHDICPLKKLSDMDIMEVEHDVRIAFKIIGFEPENLNKSFTEAWETSDATLLSSFVYDVWRMSQ